MYFRLEYINILLSLNCEFAAIVNGSSDVVLNDKVGPLAQKGTAQLAQEATLERVKTSVQRLRAVVSRLSAIMTQGVVSARADEKGALPSRRGTVSAVCMLLTLGARVLLERPGARPAAAGPDGAAGPAHPHPRQEGRARAVPQPGPSPAAGQPAMVQVKTDTCVCVHGSEHGSNIEVNPLNVDNIQNSLDVNCSLENEGETPGRPILAQSTPPASRIVPALRGATAASTSTPRGYMPI